MPRLQQEFSASRTRLILAELWIRIFLFPARFKRVENLILARKR